MGEKSRLIIVAGISVCLILITWMLFSWPIDLYSLKFWIFIFTILFEVVIVIIVNEFLINKHKKKKITTKVIQKRFNIVLMITFIALVLFLIALNILIWGYTSLDNLQDIYPEGTSIYELEDYDKELIIPSYSVINGEYWDELIIFNSPKSTSQLESELRSILNSEPFERITTDNGVVYYNLDFDYTITGYDVNRGLFINSFNLVYCDGLCN